jgi:hypothetical protein
MRYVSSGVFLPSYGQTLLESVRTETDYGAKSLQKSRVFSRIVPTRGGGYVRLWIQVPIGTGSIARLSVLVRASTGRSG